MAMARLLLLGWLVHVGRATEYLSCQALRETALSPAYWRPAVIMDSLDLSLENLRPAPVDEEVHLHGLCGKIESSFFEWQKPGNDGGEWLATTESAEISINTGHTQCLLTGLAVGTTEPTMRLQFEECDGKAAVIVMLRPQKGGMKLVQWICAVSAGTDLCSKAAAAVGHSSVSVTSIRETLDLTAFNAALAEGLLHTNARSACFENLHWFTAQNGLGIAEEEWPLLMEIRKLLAPKKVPSMPVEVEVQVSEVCFLNCTQQWNLQKCGALPAAALHAPEVVTPKPLEVPQSAVLSRERLEKFGEALSDSETAPWMWLLLVFGLMIGIFFAMLLFPVFAYKEIPKRPLRYKQVELLDASGTTVPMRMAR
ncbi:unnamed protein product [Durusdinium trenchii]|uniref:Uncharacterized protein n=2 Tax=Durusdinium trenchii TaxID=1381693 RepID=A0ABP0JJS7_9DINO